MDFTVTQPEQHEAMEFPINRDSQILHWDETIHWILTPNDIETHTQIQLSTCAGADACKVRDALIMKPCLTAWNLQSWPIKPKSNLINAFVYHLPMWKGRHTQSKWFHWLAYGTYRDPFKSPSPKAWKSSDESCGAGEAGTTLGTAGVATWRSRFEDWLRLICLGWTGSSLVSFVPGISIDFNNAKTCGEFGKGSKMLDEYLSAMLSRERSILSWDQ